MKTPAIAATAAVCASLLVLSGCLKPPPVSGPRARPAAVEPAPAGAGKIVVARGDTLNVIARRTGAPVETLVAANGLAPPYTVYPGQVLALSAPAAPAPAHTVRTPPFGADAGRTAVEDGVYTVAPGDTLFALARRLGVSFGELSRANGLAEPYLIRAGQRLRVPGAWEPTRPAESRPPVAVAALPPPAAAPEPATEPAAAAPAPAPAPEPEPAPVSAPRPIADIRAAPPPPPAPRPAVERAAEPAAAPAPIRVAQRVARPGAEPQAAPAAARRSGDARHAFLWPVEGAILSGFGPGEGVTRNDGINIAAQSGAPVRAAESGVVVYAGNELRGYGNLLLIRHAGGWTSAYAHNAELMVKRGAAVERGQVIARVGATGGVSRPQSHFELRKGTEAVDPLKYLAPR